MDLISIAPPNPTSETPVTISVLWTGCLIDFGIERTGNTFDVHINYSSICFAAPPGGVFEFPVGKLASGHYNVVNEVFIEGELQGTVEAPFVVTPALGFPAPVPAFNAGGVCALLAVVIIGAAAALRRKAHATG